MSLAVFFAMLVRHAHTTGVLVIFGLRARALHGRSRYLWFSIAGLRAALGEPMKFTYTRTWRRDEAFWYSWASTVLRDGGFTAEADRRRREGASRDPRSRRAATAFERAREAPRGVAARRSGAAHEHLLAALDMDARRGDPGSARRERVP